jgi:hypothetical protein
MSVAEEVSLNEMPQNNGMCATGPPPDCWLLKGESAWPVTGTTLTRDTAQRIATCNAGQWSH